MRRVLAVLVFGVMLASCTSSAATNKQAELAGTLYSETLAIDSELLDGETTISAAITAHDAAAIETVIMKADDFKRSWRKKMAEATGPLADGASAYEESLGVRIKAYEAASRTARLRQVEDSREMVRLQRDGWDKAQEASAKIKALNKK